MSSNNGITIHRDKVGHCLREAMAERYARTKPLFNKIVANLEPKPLTCSSLRTDTFVSFCPPMTISLHEEHHSVMIEPHPSIVSDADIRETSSQEGDDDSSSLSTDSLNTCSMFVSNEYYSQSVGTTEDVDALHELPSHRDEAATSLQCSSNSHPFTGEGLAEVVDALYELPSQGEWEALILPRASFTMSGISYLVTV